MPYPDALRGAPTSLPVYGVPTAPIAAVATETQRVSEWCWLATTASVDCFYGGGETQCELADRMHGVTTCCRRPTSVACNQPGRVDEALERLDHLDWAEQLQYGEAPELRDVVDELGRARPPIAQFTFTGGGSHAVLLAGHGEDADGNEIVQIGDPADGWNPTDLVWQRARDYRYGVAWTHVFRTKP